MKALLAHPGTQYSAQLALQLQRRDSLARFWTGLLFSRASLAGRLGSVLAPSRLSNRIIDGLPPAKIRTTPLLELAHLLAIRRGTDAQSAIARRNLAFQRAIPASEFARADAVIGFDTSSRILADRAKEYGKPLIVDQTIAHPLAKEQVYEKLRDEFPDWREELPQVISLESERDEHAKADRIVAASTFTAKSLVANGIPAKKISVNPYGVNTARFAPKRHKQYNRGLRFVFAGAISARKGVPLLLQAWAKAAPAQAELWLVGGVSPGVAEKIDGANGVKLIGKVPNSEVATIMRDSDVFVFPSYFEGFGLVILEALACGLPVITTSATAGPDVLTEGKDGWIIEPGDLAGLVARIEWCSDHRTELAALGVNARNTAERFSWDAYGDRWCDILQLFQTSPSCSLS